MFQRCIDYVDYRRAFLARGRQTREGGEKKLQAKCVNIMKTVGDTSKVTIND